VISVRADEGPRPPELPAPAASRGLGGATVAWLAVAALYLLVVRFGPDTVRQAIVPEQLTDLVWLPAPGPGGGGGGGNQQPDPPKPMEVPARQQQVSVPPPPPEPTLVPRVEDIPTETLNIPAQLQASAADLTIGAPLLNPPTTSTGSGTGSGVGPGRGSGLGPGSGGGTGGDVFRAGNGVEWARPLSRVSPQYTADAVRAKVQGVVQLECVVLATGSVGDCEVTRSLDRPFGLDQEAIRAARQWRFQPGTRQGRPVATFVTIELEFSLR
jgi:protein TonB